MEAWRIGVRFSRSEGALGMCGDRDGHAVAILVRALIMFASCCTAVRSSLVAFSERDRVSRGGAPIVQAECRGPGGMREADRYGRRRTLQLAPHVHAPPLAHWQPLLQHSLVSVMVGSVVLYEVSVKGRV